MGGRHARSPIGSDHRRGARPAPALIGGYRAEPRREDHGHHPVRAPEHCAPRHASDPAIHRAARRKVNAALRAGDIDAIVDVRGAIEELVWDRRAADKVAPLVRWALHQIRHDPRLRDAEFAERLHHFRQLLPDNAIGRHALSHIAWPLERLDAEPRQFTERSPCDVLVRALYEAGYHRELNARLRIQQLPLLTGVHDIDRFASAAGRATWSIVEALASEVGLRQM